MTQLASVSLAHGPSRSLGDVMRLHNGLGPGFDTLRLALSLGVMSVHSVTLFNGLAYFDFREWWGYPLFLALLPMFFGLSGFLVAGSAVRLQRTSRFMLNRGFRIIPALAVEVALSALVLGAVVTTLPLGEYYLHPQFWAYFQNIVGVIHFELQGVFQANVFPNTVNGNLWTLQPEYYCYLLLAAAMASGLFNRRRIYLAMVALASLGLVAMDVLWSFGKPLYAVSTSVLVFCFFFGSLIYLLADRIAFDWRLAALATVGYVALSQVNGTVIVSMMLLCYVTIYLGLCKLPRMGLLHKGDYSYGIYLYGFPIQQTLSHYFPGFQPWWLTAVAAVLLTICFSVVSWHLIEKPALALRNRF